MKNIKWFKRGIAIALLISNVLFGTTVPVLAADTQQGPQLSRWAIGVLNEGEKYGIFPIEWYYSGFQDTISQERLQSLLDALSNKFAKLELKEKEGALSQKIAIGSTRGEVIASLYNIVSKYELPKEINTASYKPHEYFQKLGILLGSEEKLELDKPCTVEQAVVFSIRLVEAIYNGVDAGSKGLLWKVSKGENTMYLLGSIHIGNTDIYPLNKNLKTIFRKSDKLFVEADIFNEQGYQDFLAQTVYSDGTTIKDHISKETYEKALKVFEKYGLPKEQLDRLKVWTVTNNLTTISASSSTSAGEGMTGANLGIDMYFMTESIVTGKPIEELEGLKKQAGFFEGLSKEAQEESLNAILDDILNQKEDKKTEGAEQITLWQTLWAKGDFDGFADSYSPNLENTESEYVKMLVGKRDEAMADKLAKVLEEKGKHTYFVVVGTGHLIVKDTIVDLLKSKGYNVEKVKY